MAQGFDFTKAIRVLCVDAVTRLPELRHVDMQRVAISMRLTRKPGPAGMQAALTPLRFAGGAEFEVRRGRRFRVERVLNEGGYECLYLLSFYLPRFLDLPFDEKLVTVVHELWHIAPRFDGDLRRHPGRCYAHRGSRAAYDDEMRLLVERWMADRPASENLEFLRLDFAGLRQAHGEVWGHSIRRPRLLPID